MDNKFKIDSSLVSDVYYVPEFIDVIEEEQLLRNIYNVPQSKWVELSNRRLQNWGGSPHPTIGMVPEPIPQWLQAYMDRVSNLNVFLEKRPNHVLINEYKPNQGIMPHLDGRMYFPVIATINLGSHTVLDFYNIEKRETIAFSMYLEPRSLLIQRGDVYGNYMHGIVEREEDTISDSFLNMNKTGKNLVVGERFKRSTRVSLTIRHVLKISKLKIKLCR